MFETGFGQVGIGMQAEVEGLNDINIRLEQGLMMISSLRNVIRRYAEKTQAQAVLNVSGVSVSFNGTTFIVNRQTGKLVRSIQVFPDPGGSPLSMAVIAGANYASAIEQGRRAIDMKALLMGKVVPIPIRGSKKDKAAAVASGLATKVSRKTSGGKSAPSDIIAFRKIGPNSKGWIIPAQRPRPFMQAAAEYILPQFNAAVAQTYADYLSGDLES